ncbi:MAG: amidohydrolase [Opitutales bacterium]|nr:amidohydrolase [Opitutales bacterium]
MRKILLKDTMLNGNRTDVLIAGHRFEKIAPGQIADAGTEIVNATGTAILPPFYNTHTHAAMTLLRGYADDKELFTWLNDHIWPFEAKMTARDIYEGSRLAILEMIRSGTVFFNDMYWQSDETVRAASEMGIRACVGMTVTDFIGEAAIEATFERLAALKPGNWADDAGLVRLTLAPHAVYTVCEKLWRRCADFARERGLLLHIHLAETRKEIADCVAAHGKTPVRWLDSLGVLGENVIAAHVVHVDDEEISILRERGVVIAHNPCSNMKLASGTFRSQAFSRAGCRVTIGTDGNASNNNLDMREETKFAALLAKVSGDPEALPAEEALAWATRNGAEAFGIDAGVIAEGRLADAVLVDLNNERLVPSHNLISNWVYSADSRCIRDVICNGKFLMRSGVIEGEAEILDAVRSLPLLNR